MTGTPDSTVILHWQATSDVWAELPWRDWVRFRGCGDGGEVGPQLLGEGGELVGDRPTQVLQNLRRRRPEFRGDADDLPCGLVPGGAQLSELVLVALGPRLAHRERRDPGQARGQLDAHAVPGPSSGGFTSLGDAARYGR